MRDSLGLTLPDGPYRLLNARVPAAVAARLGPADAQGFVRCDIPVAEGRIRGAVGASTVDLQGAIVLPGFVDCHTHLDKGHIWGRTPNPDGSFMGALDAVRGDRTERWTGEDVAARMDFALRAAYARGTVAIRSHIDTGDHRSESSWAAIAAARERWDGRIAIQPSALTVLDEVETPAYSAIADLVARHSGILGAVTYPMDDLPSRLDRFFDLAGERGLEADFHADETLDPASNTLAQIAEAVLRTGFDKPVLCGHCCALAMLPEAEAERTMDLVARAGLSIVSLPMCNMYLQDRAAGRTPRLRGITLVHELAARGVKVAFASDNTRDPFYAYGDLDMLEVVREATRIAHLDHPVGDWPAAFSRVPAAIMGLEAGLVAEGAPADLVILPGAHGWTELLARPHVDRMVLRAGRPIDTTLPDYRELDPLMAPAAQMETT